MKPERGRGGLGWRSHRKLLAAVVAVMLAGVVAAVVLVTQNGPSVPAANVTATCVDMVATPAAVAPRSTGFVVFKCENSGEAFEALGGQAVPTFSGGSEYSSLFIVAKGSAPGPECINANLAKQLVSGTAVVFPSGVSNWNYCRDFVNVGSGGLASWTISWSTP